MSKAFVRKTFALGLTLVVTTAFTCNFLSKQSTVSAAPNLPLTPMESDNLAAMRAAGLAGDRTQLLTMMQALSSDHPAYVSKALYALSHLKATEALPAIDAIANKPQPDYVLHSIKIAHARISSEARADNFALPTGRSSAKVESFLTALNLSGNQLNTSSLDYHSKHEGEYDAPLEVSVVQELADMAYQDDAVDYKQIPQLSGIDFSVDPGASLKMQVVQVPKSSRLKWMIDTLAKKKIRGGTEAMLTQLIVDEGLPASRAAGDRLEEMQAHPTEYSEIGFGLLFDVIRGVGDKTQAPIVKRFLNDPIKDGGVSLYARTDYPFIVKGLRCQYAVGY